MKDVRSFDLKRVEDTHGENLYKKGVRGLLRRQRSIVL